MTFACFDGGIILENVIRKTFTVRQPSYVHFVLLQPRVFWVLHHGDRFFLSAVSSAAQRFSAGYEHSGYRKCGADSLQVS